ncbi:hypothetical protein [Streptomyces sp. NPDC007346]|uniref:hypothetical protein n=1 Tax=Streptomyces sp. NPDC007346 TaxID=3154682 RepID=UPI0034560196
MRRTILTGASVCVVDEWWTRTRLSAPERDHMSDIRSPLRSGTATTAETFVRDQLAPYTTPP